MKKNPKYSLLGLTPWIDHLFIVSLSMLYLDCMAFDAPRRIVYTGDSPGLLLPLQAVSPDASSVSGLPDNLPAVALTISRGKVDDVKVLAFDDSTLRSDYAATYREWIFRSDVCGTFVILPGKSVLPCTAPVSEVDLDKMPKPLLLASPSYPRRLRAVISWSVDVEVIVDKCGVPISVKVLGSSASDFEPNACLAALFSRFEVGTKGGAPVAYTTKCRIAFNVNQ
jgi:hypothetical protein